VPWRFCRVFPLTYATGLPLAMSAPLRQVRGLAAGP